MTAPTPSSEQRIAVVRSLIGHRLPSDHLVILCRLALDGATWEQIWDLDAESEYPQLSTTLWTAP